MSSTSKPPQAPPGHNPSAGASAETGAGAARDIPPFASSTEQAVRDIVDRPEEAPAKTQSATADVLREMARRNAAQADEALRVSLQAAAGAQAPLVDAGHQGERNLLDTTMRVAAIHFGVVQRTADDVKALSGSLYALARGPHAFQKACLDFAGQSVSAFTSIQRDVSWTSSPVAFAELQRDFYTGMVDRCFSGYAEWLRIGSEVAQDGLCPIKERILAR